MDFYKLKRDMYWTVQTGLPIGLMEGNTNKGLCKLLYPFLTGDVIARACTGWEHWSGLIHVPINMPGRHPYHAYMAGGLYQGLYGQRRYELYCRVLSVIEDRLEKRSKQISST